MSKISLQLLRNLNGWIHSTIASIVCGDTQRATLTLRKIIDTLENPQTIDNLKAILTALTSNENSDDAA